MFMRRFEFDAYNAQKVELHALRTVYALFATYILVCMLTVLVWGKWIALAFSTLFFLRLEIPLFGFALTEGLKFSQELVLEWLEGSVLSVFMGFIVREPIDIYLKVMF